MLFAYEFKVGDADEDDVADGDLVPGVTMLVVRKLLHVHQSCSHAAAAWNSWAGVFMDLRLIKHPECWTLLLWS